MLIEFHPPFQSSTDFITEISCLGEVCPMSFFCERMKGLGTLVLYKQVLCCLEELIYLFIYFSFQDTLVPEEWQKRGKTKQMPSEQKQINN